ncbi:family 10 glycoside hydrolase [Phakopsora pachyrhizi]|nr:family 10 glycoside hydrolase [Phakopsora pachyrhizi]
MDFLKIFFFLALKLTLLERALGAPQPKDKADLQQKNISKSENSTHSASYLGTAVSGKLLESNSAYKNIVKKYFQVMTPENEMKWQSLKPNRDGQYNFNDMDKIIEFGQQNKKKVRGHTIIWHRQYPQWLENLDKNSLLEETNKHIETVMERYASKLISMDVCNEIIADDGSLRQNIWMKKIGEDYITQVFQMARKASQKYNPKLKLYINDYSIEGINKKSNKLYEIAGNLKKLGILDGLGFQSHLIVGQVPKDMTKNMERFADLGLEVTISELDIRMELSKKSESVIKQQEDDYKQVTKNCKAVKNCAGVVVWGVTDKDSWIPKEFPGYGDALLFDANNQPKTALKDVMQIMGRS